MAASQVQKGSAATNGGGTGAVSPTLPSGVLAGSCIFAHVAAFLGLNGGNFTCSDTTNWKRAQQDVTRANVQSAIFYRENATAGEAMPTFSYSLSANVWVALREFSGIQKSPVPLDKSGGANAAGTNLPSGAAPTATCGGVDVHAGDLVITSDAFSFGSAVAITSQDSYNNGATPTDSLQGDASATRQHYRFAYGITTSKAVADTNSPFDNQTGTGDVISTVIASFKVILTGAAAVSETLTITAAGTRTAIGAATRNETLTIAVAGTRTTFAAATRNETLTITLAGIRTTFGAATRSETLTITAAGTRTTFGAATRAETLTITLAGTRTTFGAAVRNETLTIAAAGTRTTFGAATRAETLTITAAGTTTVYGAATLAMTATIAVASIRTTFGSCTLDETLAISCLGGIAIFGSATLPLTIHFVAAGVTEKFAAAVLPLILTITATAEAITVIPGDVTTGQIALGRGDDIAEGEPGRIALASIGTVEDA